MKREREERREKREEKRDIVGTKTEDILNLVSLFIIGP